MPVNKIIIDAWADPASGPGWANTPVCYIEYDGVKNEYQRYWIQPEAQTEKMRTLFKISAEVHNLMVREAEKIKNA